MVDPTIFIFSAGAIHESPAMIRGYRLFSGAPRDSPTGWFEVCEDLFVFYGGTKTPPYRKLLTLHSAL